MAWSTARGIKPIWADTEPSIKDIIEKRVIIQYFIFLLH